MDLIDRSKLNLKDIRLDKIEDLIGLLVAVDTAPTLDPAQLVPQGEWVMKHPNGYACSKCGEWGLMLDNRGIYPSNFCPSRGARMREENNVDY